MAPEQEQYFVGKEIPESELELTTKRYPWEEILESIALGTAREVVMSYQTVKNAIEDLVTRGKIRKDEYYIVTKGTGAGKKRRVFIGHRRKKPA